MFVLDLVIVLSMFRVEYFVRFVNVVVIYVWWVMLCIDFFFVVKKMLGKCMGSG